MSSWLPLRDRDYLENHELTFEEHDFGGQKGLILRGIPLPAEKFDAALVDVLFLIPPGYPDVAPDMFYTIPWVKLRASNAYARAADQPHDFAGVRWQRWSRHSDQWRGGRDGIWTLILRFQHAVEVAQ